MRTARNEWLVVPSLLLLGLLVWGLSQVALAPLESGEVYPPYSTLRADPLGAKALYESLEQLPGVAVERWYKPRAAFRDRESAFVILGADPASWVDVTEATLAEYEAQVSGGGRLVIAFVPVRAAPRVPQNKVPNKSPDFLQERWGLALGYHPPERQHPVDGAMPRTSVLYFNAGTDWRTLRESRGFPSAVEHSFGAGTIALVADSYPLSNEGLREDRDAAFIALLLGPARRVAFDENHFGVAESGSVTTLMRKYRLEGGVAILLIAVGLFLWRSASSLLPPRASASGGPVEGRESLEGLTALLRRGIPEKDLLRVCLTEWRKIESRDVQDVERGIGREQNPVEAYRAACKILTERK